MPYTRPYTGGFKDYPDTTTPINATALNTMDVGIKTANDQFQTVTTAQRTALTPTVGQAVWDSDLKQLMVYMNASGGNAWQAVGNTIICTSTTRPATPFHGQMIYETDTKKEYTYNGSAWVQTNTASTTSGVTGVSNLIVPPTARIALTGTKAIPNGTDFSWDTAIYDNDGMWSAGTPTRLTVQTAGIYLVVAGIMDYITSTTSTMQSWSILRNGSYVASNRALTSIASEFFITTVSFVFQCSVGDYFTTRGDYTGGTHTAQNDARCSLTATWIGRTS